MAVNFIYEFRSKVVNKPKGIIIANRRYKPSQSCDELKRYFDFQTTDLVIYIKYRKLFKSVKSS